MKYTVRVWAWNTNGTNDIEILRDGGTHPSDVNYIPEALFGVDTGDAEYVEMLPRSALKHVASSPVNDGSKLARILKNLE
jgi:hypothetical protein